MRKFLAVMLLCVPVAAQKMHVKVAAQTIDGVPFTRYVPGIGLNNGNASANCAVYGNTANCSGSSTGSSIYLPSHTVSGSLRHVEMLLLLPDGRSTVVYCNDHLWGLTQAHLAACKNPEVDGVDADFSGDKVKLTWGVGLDGKKKESQTFIIGKVFPAPIPAPKP